MRLIRAIIGAMAVVVLCQAGPAAAGPAKNGKAVAYAKVNTNDGSVLSFGGAKTTSAVGSLNIASDMNVTFTGKYPPDITSDQVIVQATCEYGSYCVANAAALSASPTEITLHVGIFDSRDGTQLPNKNAFVTVHIGQ